MHSITNLSSLAAAAGMSLGFSIAVSGCGEATHDHAAMHDTTHAASPGHTMPASANTTRIEVDADSSTWTLRVLDAATSKPVQSFDSTHDKLMHLIIVAADHEWFNHVHPEYRGNGEFVVTTSLPKSGSYVLFADYAPTGRAPEVYRHEMATGGSTLDIPMNSPAVDATGKGGWIVRTVASHVESEPASTGDDRYQIALMPMPMKLVAGQDAMLHFQVRDAEGRPVTDLEPYLGALGHAVILSSDSRTYLHTHPTDDAAGSHDHAGAGHATHGDTHAGHAHAAPASGGPDVVFHTNFPAAGLYRAWGQFQHKGRIITATFVLKVELDQA